jgi:hypothetical protein
MTKTILEQVAMNHSIAILNRLVKCFIVLVAALLYVVITSSRFFEENSRTLVRAQSSKPQPTPVDRFDALVRNDFFAGMMGDEARLNRGMKFCEEILARNPKHAEALVWHGGGLLARAAQAYTKGDTAVGDQLWDRGLEEMNNAVAFEPDHLGVKIGRSATLIGLAQSGWNPSDAHSRALLESALDDYEKVYKWQKPTFHRLSDHSRGELLFGLASGWSILGEQKKAQKYLRLVVKECKGTEYEIEARKWLRSQPLAVIQHNCTGCHIGSSR